MHKTIITILFIFSSLIIVQAQKPKLYAKYHSSYADQSYNIKIFFNDTNNYKLEIDLMTYDTEYSKGGLVITNKTLPGFIHALDTAEIYYTKWLAYARAKKGSRRTIKYFQEEKVGGYFYAKKKTRIDFPLKAKYRYRVLNHNNEIVYVLNISTGNIRSQYGHQYTVHSFSLFFQSEKEIREFKNLIAPEKVKEFINANN